MLTVLNQVQAISAKVMGPGKKTVISLHMSLYEPAEKLQKARNDLDHIILRPGELHVLMAQLRTLGAFVDNSGSATIWVSDCEANNRRQSYEARSNSSHGLFASSFYPIPKGVFIYSG